jgi:peptidoglycan/LPS O-acetylase OafA/YrhL
MPLSASTQPISVSRPPAPALHINFLDGFRGLAALYVMLFHFLDMNREGLLHWELRAARLMEAGHSSVTLFMVLSGFSLMLPVARAANGTLKGGTGGFLKRRARRILPPYYAALLLSLLSLALSPPGLAYLHGVRDPEYLSNFTAPAVLSHLFLLQNTGQDWQSRINQAMWSIATEWQIYFLLPFVLLPVWRRGGVWALAAAGLVLGVAPVGLVLRDVSHVPMAAWYIGSFTIGAVGAVWAWRGLAEEQERPALRRAALIGLGLSTVAYALACKYVAPPHTIVTNAAHNYLNAVLKDYLLSAMIACVLVYDTLARDLPASWSFTPFRLLETPVARCLGAFSYSLYLTHCIILLQANAWIATEHIAPATGFVLKGVLGLPTALLFAYLFHLAFEKPFMVTSESRNMRLLAEAPARP